MAGEVEGRVGRGGDGRQDEPVADEVVERPAARVQGEQRRAAAAGVVEAVEQLVVGGGRRGDEDGGPRAGAVDGVEADGQVRGRAGRHLTPDEDGAQRGDALPAGGVVEVGREVPRLGVRGSDDEQPPGVVTGLPQRSAEAARGRGPAARLEPAQGPREVDGLHEDVVGRPGRRLEAPTLDGVLVLALDTSSAAVSVALVDLVREDGGARWGRSAVWQRVDGQRHGELLATGIAEVLAELRASRTSLAAVAVGVGPGPFTGLRVGIVTGLALGDALGIPVYGCCSLDAVGAWDDQPGPRLVVMDARRKEVYWAEYDEDGERVAGPAVKAPADLAEAVRATGWQGRVVGDGAARYPEHFPSAAAPLHPSPDALVLVAARRVLDGAPSEPLTPLSLRRPDAVPPGAGTRVTA